MDVAVVGVDGVAAVSFLAVDMVVVSVLVVMAAVVGLATVVVDVFLLGVIAAVM